MHQNINRQFVDGDTNATLVAVIEDDAHSGTNSESSSSSVIESSSVLTSSVESGGFAPVAAISATVGRAGIVLSAFLLPYTGYAF